MDVDLIDRIEALRRPLELAAQDRFAGVSKVVGLGAALRSCCDRVIAKASPEHGAPLAQWREVLAQWERLDEGEQAAEVAKGMRLLARFPRPKRQGARAEATAVANPPPAPATDADADALGASPETLPGIGPALAERLAERGILTVEDLLWHLPRRYDDVRDAGTLAEAAATADGERATFAARVTSSRMVFARGRRWAEVRVAELSGAKATACIRWFNVWAGIDKRMPAGCEVVLSGTVRIGRSGRGLELANPDILAIEVPGAVGTPGKPAPTLLVRYPDVPGVPASRLAQACRAACARVGDRVDDGVPATVEAAASLPTLAATLSALHSPSGELPREAIEALNRGDSDWHRRLAFGELFALGVAIALRRRHRRADVAIACARAALADALARALPFRLTGAQQRAIDELAGELARDVPMNRLLQGDVGSGKTAVAFAAALQVARAGRQTAVMAPTELLAEQHAETWRRWGAIAGLRVELLTASTPQGVRASLLARLAAGQIDCALGTQALLSEGVGFAALGLVVIDEQHRFGVAQRAKLRDKGDGQGAPHLLVMTATPIPRTLALTAFGDLDATVLDELPPGRTPVETRVLRGARGYASAIAMIAARIAAGERAYVVCPKVDADGPRSAGAGSGAEGRRGSIDGAEASAKWRDATTVHGELCKALPSARIGLVHGRLDSRAREAVMRAFKLGDLDVLVATTVIEVGVDVPAATAMVVLDADRFGLAQLHQLRGRVGRGGGASSCALVTANTVSELAQQRLAAVVASTDGFAIAEQDLALRGPGEMFGPRQAGVPRLRFGDLAQHTALLLAARGHAEAVLAADPELVWPDHAGVARAVARRNADGVFGAEGG